MDFTLETYKNLLKSLINNDYSFVTVSDFISNPTGRVIILRNDVDSHPQNSLKFAEIQKELNIKATYYFRIVNKSWDERIIEQISGLNHEVGYHYEDVSLVAKRTLLNHKLFNRYRGQDHEKSLCLMAIESFKSNLARFTEIVNVKTICMHGSPLSRWDNRLMWKYFDYHKLGIIGEPYFDIDDNDILYLTDTGRRWDGDKYSIRDRIGLGYDSKINKYHSTKSIIIAANNNQLPDKILITFHPQRWTDQTIPWMKELIFQNIKNIVKFSLRKIRNN